MKALFLTALSLCVSGSVLALVLLAIKPVVKKRLSQTWQYYIWLVVVLRLLLPIAPQGTLIGTLAERLQEHAVIVSEKAERQNPADRQNTGNIVFTQKGLVLSEERSIPDKEIAGTNSAGSSGVLNTLALFWLAVGFILFARKVLDYRKLVRLIKSEAVPATERHLIRLYEEEQKSANIKKMLPLYIHEQAASPMQIGIVHAAVVLPVLNTSDDNLRQIFRHELTHYRRRDAVYKWIVQFAVCIHWFNPLVYRIRKEINRCCELSCDERVIRDEDGNGRILYGDALMAACPKRGSLKEFNGSLAMGENAALIKERLDMMMSYKKKSKYIVCVTVWLTLLILCGFSALGVYAISPITNSESKKEAEYQAWNVTCVNGVYYNHGKRIRLLADMNADDSFHNFCYDKNGLTDLRLIRDTDGSILKTELLSRAEAEEMQRDLEDSLDEDAPLSSGKLIQKEKSDEGVLRCVLEEESNAVQEALSRCDSNLWYVLEDQGRSYVYYKGLPCDYAFQFDADKDCINIIDIGHAFDNYVLISLPLNSNLKILYNSNMVTYTNIKES